MKYLSVCSGIEAASVAWHPLGWTPLAFSEIEPFPRAVLAHHYPDVPCHGDFTVLRDQPWIVDADVLVGGTPCQAFSVAGLRNSLADDRGNLSLEYVRLADAIDALRLAAGKPEAIIVWENVPGVLSVKDNAFGCFLAALAGDASPYVPPRGKWTDAGVVAGPERTVAWRILDAQFFALAQRRRRVFVVASARKGFDPSEVLFERESLQRYSAPSREARESITHSTAPCLTSSGRGVERTGDTRGQDPVVAVQELAPTLDAQMDRKWGSNQWVNNGFAVVQPVCMSSGQANAEIRTDGGAPALTCLHEAPIAAYAVPSIAFPAFMSGTQVEATEELAPAMGAENQTAVAYAFQPRIARNGRGDMGEVVNALNAQSGETGKGDAAPCVAIGVQASQSGVRLNETAGTLDANYGPRRHNGVMQSMAVRRLTPIECERLQGFPDNYTAIPWKKKPAADCPDGPRYKALGNSMATPCMRFIGTRIVNAIAASNPIPGVRPASGSTAELRNK